MGTSEYMHISCIHEPRNDIASSLPLSIGKEKKLSGEVYTCYYRLFVFDHNQIFFYISHLPKKTVCSLGTSSDLLFISFKIWSMQNKYFTCICWKGTWMTKNGHHACYPWREHTYYLSCKPSFPFPNESSMANIWKPKQMETKLLPNISGDYKALCNAFPFYLPA